MIKSVFANNPSFKTVEFHSGFNVVLADRTQQSTKKDSRNGLGKSTLVEIIHFCLGAKAVRGKGLLVSALKGWTFSVVIQIGHRDLTLTREVDYPNVVIIDQGASPELFLGKLPGSLTTHSLQEFNQLMGLLLFGLNNTVHRQKYQPTFRGLISYFIRKGKAAFLTPFEHFQKQPAWDRQVHNAFLLGLNWEDAADIQKLNDRKNGLTQFKSAVKSGVVQGVVGSLGDLVAQKVRLKTRLDQEADQLLSFRVHPLYSQFQDQANTLTQEIHDLVDSQITSKRLIEVYNQNLNEEDHPFDGSIEQIYREAGIVLPGVTLRRVNEVQEFHKTIVENRRIFLFDEIERLSRQILQVDDVIRDKTEKRASIMEVLQTHGALEEYTLLQKQYMDTVNSLNSITSMIDNLKKFETGLSDVKIAQEELQKKARRDYDERAKIREKAIKYFNYYSESLYNVPGKLIIDVGTSGFTFDVEIERSGSSGINNMKVFCYDLMLARLWAYRISSPKMCIHDSIIFDGVDERQRALALETAANESHKHGFQYICALNSDYIPWEEFSTQFDFNKYVRLTLTDESSEGCLLGIQF